MRRPCSRPRRAPRPIRGSVGVRQRVEATVGEHALLVVISDPLVPFADARIDALLDVELGDGATLAAVEGLAAGRVASGERWAAARCQTRLRVRRGGALLLDDALLLDPAQGDVAARMGPFDAWANVVLVRARSARGGELAARACTAAAPPRRGGSRDRAGDAARGRMPPADRGGVDGYPQRPGPARRSHASVRCSGTIRSPAVGRKVSRTMHLTPRELDKLVLHGAGVLAQKRLARGLRLNYPEAVALIATQLLELIRDGRARRRADGRRAPDARPRGR